MLAVTQSEPEAMQRQIGTAFISLRISPGLGRVRPFVVLPGHRLPVAVLISASSSRPPLLQVHQALVKADPHFCAVDEAKQVVAQVELEGSTSKQPAAGARHDRTGSLSSHFSLESSPKGRTTRSPSKSASVAAAVPESSSMDSLGSRERERDSDEDDLSSQEDDLVDGEENGEFYRTRERDPKIFVRCLPALLPPLIGQRADCSSASRPPSSTRASCRTRPSARADGPRTRSRASCRASRSSTSGASALRLFLGRACH